MANDKRDRRGDLLRDLNKRRFEEEVAEEIGISLERRTGRPARRARDAAASPGADGRLPGARDRGRPEV